MATSFALGCAGNSNQAPAPCACSQVTPPPNAGSPATPPPYAGSPATPTTVTTSAGAAPSEIAIPNDSTWSLREREQWAQVARHVRGALKAVNDSCRSQIEGAFVFETFRGHFHPANPYGIGRQQGDSHAAAEHARTPFIAVQQICDDGDMQRAAVRAKIRRIEVRYTPTGRSTFALNGGVLTGTINPSGESESDYRNEIRGPTGLRRQL